MSGLETLSPDQRAVLQLILAQGRGYADLAATLKLDAAAVRERALAGVEGLGVPRPAALDDAARGRVADYLLGQLDDGERIVAFAELGASPDACAWAQALREQLAPIAREELPEVPAAAAAAPTPAANGSRAADVGASAPTATDSPVAAPAAAAVAAPPAAAPAPSPSAAATPPAPPAPPAPRDPEGGGPSSPRPSRLGGAILIAGAAALAIVLAIVLIGGGGGDSSSPSGSTSGAQTQANARTQTSTTGSTGSSQDVIGAAALRATPAGGKALGAALVQRLAGGRREIAVEMARIAPNGAQDAYAIWLQGSGGARLLGFVPTPVGRERTFTVSAPLASGLTLADYATVLVTRETTTAQPTAPGTVIASGPLRLAG